MDAQQVLSSIANLERAAESGETLDYEDFRNLSALLELAQMAGTLPDSLERVRNFLLGDFAAPPGRRELKALRRLVWTMVPVASHLRHGLYVLINPAHYTGSILLHENDRGIYEDAWEALADLAEAKWEAGNPDIYLARVTRVRVPAIHIT